MRNDRIHILRESVVKITQMLSGRGIRVTQQGVNAYVKADHDGTPVLVNLPYVADNAGEDLILAIQGFLDHEVAHILFTNFPTMGKALKISKRIGFLLNALEDPRIEKEMAKRFQGSAYNLRNTGEFYLNKFIVPRMKEKMAAGDKVGVIETLMVPMLRAMSGQAIFQEFMNDKWTLVAPIHKKIADLEERIEAASSTEDCYELAKEIGKRLSDKGDRGDGEGEEGEDGEEGTGKRSKSKSKGKGSGKGKSAKGSSSGEDDDESGESESSGKNATEDGEDEGEGGGKGDADEKKEDKKDGESEDKKGGEEEGDGAGKEGGDDDAEGDADDEEEDEDDGEIGPGGKRKTELSGDDEEGELDDSSPVWEALDKDTANDFDEAMSQVLSETSLKSAKNAEYLPFTKDYDVVEKLPIGTGYDDSMTSRLVDKVDHMVGPLQKDLERAITARSLATRSHGHRSGRLHSANLARLHFNDDRVFSRKHESTSKDVAVELVVDASGSMAGSKIHTACQAAYALSSVLERLHIKNEVICFTTKDIGGAHKEMYDQQAKTGIRFSRAEGLYMPILKTYDERMSTEVRERFGWLPYTSILRSNVDGECVEIAARRLMARKEAGKIMIVLSDGYPAAAGDRGGLEQHLLQVVKDVTASGIKVVGIGIESTAVQKFYPKNIVLNNVEQLPGAVIKELRHLLMH